MRSVLIIMGLFFFSLVGKGQTSFYSFSIESIAGNQAINFSSFAGKKILIVNMASGDTSFSQYNQLKELYQIYKDSLVIVVIPANILSKELGTNEQIASLYAFNPVPPFTFNVAAKMNITTANMHPLFMWLTTASLNGAINSQISKPGYKFLINKNGSLVGVFTPRIKPMSSILIQAIQLR